LDDTSSVQIDEGLALCGESAACRFGGVPQIRFHSYHHSERWPDQNSKGPKHNWERKFRPLLAMIGRNWTFLSSGQRKG